MPSHVRMGSSGEPPFRFRISMMQSNFVGNGLGLTESEKFHGNLRLHKLFINDCEADFSTQGPAWAANKENLKSEYEKVFTWFL